MSNILRRPMFKLGGQSSDGVGITSGFNINLVFILKIHILML